MKIGILAIQGSVVEHRRALEKLGIQVQEVRLPEDLQNISGIILPGGESTTQSKLLRRFGLFEPLQKKITAGLPVWGTCAGAILLAKKVLGKNPPETLKVMDITANRNWYGAQRESFIGKIEVQLFAGEMQNAKCKMQNFEGVFIRAPKLVESRKLKVKSENSKFKIQNSVKILAKYKNTPVLLEQGNMLAGAFHPELTDDLRIHRYFVKKCKNEMKNV